MTQVFSDQDFEERVIRSDKPVLVDFWAPWCGPCQMMGPIVEELDKKLGEKVYIGKLNVDENPNTAQKYQVMSIPTLIIFKDGQIVEQIVGLQTKEALEERLKTIIS